VNKERERCQALRDGENARTHFLVAAVLRERLMGTQRVDHHHQLAAVCTGRAGDADRRRGDVIAAVGVRAGRDREVADRSGGLGVPVRVKGSPQSSHRSHAKRRCGVSCGRGSTRRMPMPLINKIATSPAITAVSPTA
jgi:hypothetical protein